MKHDLIAAEIKGMREAMRLATMHGPIEPAGIRSVIEDAIGKLERKHKAA